METGRSKGECCRRKAILLSLSDMSGCQTIVEGHNSQSRPLVGPPPPAKRVDCGNIQFPMLPTVCSDYEVVAHDSTSMILNLIKFGMHQGDPHDSSDEEWDQEMVRCSHHPPEFDNHILDADVDMVNLLATGFAHDEREGDGDVGEAVVQGGDGGPAPSEHVEERLLGDDSNDSHVYEGDADDADEDGVETDESSVSDESDGPEDDDIGAMASDTEVEEEELPGLRPSRIQEEILHNEAACTPLFGGSRLSRLAATILIMNTCRVHRCSNAFIDELLSLLSNSVLPSANHLPKTEYEASKEMKRLGFGYNTIDACVRGCTLFWKTHKDATECPKCHQPRYRQVGECRVPRKVLRHFPIIPRLQRMFGTEAQAKLMTWHSRNRSTDGKMRMVPDSPQWRFVDTNWPEFGADPRNIRLGLAADGVNPFAEKRSNWSTWPISLVNFNLPPWLATKKHFLILALIIPGPECVTAENIDIFLEPVVDELMELWQHGVETVDSAAYGGSRVFNMKAMLIMTIHDLEAYSIVNGCMVKGNHGCPICGPNCMSRYSFTLGKNVYNAQYRRWLPFGHPYRENAVAFDGSVEERPPPTNVTAADTMRWAEERKRWLRDGGAPARDDPALRTGVKRLPILFCLPYWKVHSFCGR